MTPIPLRPLLTKKWCYYRPPEFVPLVSWSMPPWVPELLLECFLLVLDFVVVSMVELDEPCLCLLLE